jgi:tetratricopeptide (TPR) repeat protein
VCGCLPLALRIAGNCLALNDDCTPEAYATLLANERTRLTYLKDDQDPRLDVAANIALSVAQLDADTRRAWALLGLFPAPFDVAAVRAVWSGEELLPVEQVLATLRALCNRSLLSYDAGPAPSAAKGSDRYYQHDLLRLAAARELPDVGDAKDARLRYARYYLEIAGAANSLYLEGGADLLRGLALFDQEWPHIRAGQAWAAAHAPADAADARLTSDYPEAGVYLLALRLHPRDRIAWLRAAVDAARRLDDKAAKSGHLDNLGLAHADLGQVRTAIDYHQQALAISREIGDRRSEGADLGNLGTAYARLGETRTAIDYHQQALAIYRDIGDRRGEGSILGNLGLAYMHLGETLAAIECYEGALAIAREIGDRRVEGNDLGNLGSAHADLGDLRTAIEHYEQALAIAREIGDRRGEGNWLGNLGDAYARLRETSAAIDYYEGALAIAREIGDRRSEGNWLGNLGNAYADLGEARTAIDSYEQALAIVREIGDRHGEANTCWNLGLLYKDIDPARAVELMEISVAHEREIGHPNAEADAQRVVWIRYRLASRDQ